MAVTIQKTINAKLQASLVSQGIHNAELDANGHLILTLKDGDTVDVGRVVGYDGAQGPAGNTGNDGQPPNITIGTVETLSAGSAATASISGTTPDLTLNLGIPQGAEGAAGSTYTLPAAASGALGGVKADSKTNESVSVKIGTDDKLYVPAYPSVPQIASDISAENDNSKTAGPKAVKDFVNANKPRIATVTVGTADWTTDNLVHSYGMNGQLTLAGITLTANSQIHVTPDPVLLAQAQTDGFALVAGNNAGTAVIYAVGTKPTAQISVGLSVAEVQ